MPDSNVKNVEYIYVLVRQDLTPSQQAVQACHVCLEAGKHHPYQRDHPHLILLGVKDEVILSKWFQHLESIGLKTVKFIEPDLNNSLTAIAISGIVEKSHRSLFRSLPLVKISEVITMNAIQSRWGFHPCTYELYLKLKRLNFLVSKAFRVKGEYKRWSRKRPQNRRIFVGGKDGWVGKKRDIPKEHRIYKPWSEPILAPLDENTMLALMRDFANARTPTIENQVKPLHFSEKRIIELLEMMEEWANPEICKNKAA